MTARAVRERIADTRVHRWHVTSCDTGASSTLLSAFVQRKRHTCGVKVLTDRCAICNAEKPPKDDANICGWMNVLLKAPYPHYHLFFCPDHLPKEIADKIRENLLEWGFREDTYPQMLTMTTTLWQKAHPGRNPEDGSEFTLKVFRRVDYARFVEYGEPTPPEPIDCSLRCWTPGISKILQELGKSARPSTPEPDLAPLFWLLGQDYWAAEGKEP